MTGGELAFLLAVIGAFTAFSALLAWVTHEYVRDVKK
jgi:hypothetical protein